VSEEKDKSLEEINEERRRRLLELAERDMEAERVDREKARNLLQLPEVLRAADTVRRVYVKGCEGLFPDGYVEYCILNYREAAELEQYKDRTEFNLHYVYKCLSKANPAITLETVENLPSGLVNLIAVSITQEESRFLLPAWRHVESISRRTLEQLTSGSSAESSG